METRESTSFGLVLILWLAGLCAAAQFAKFSVIFPTLETLYPNTGAALGFLVSLISLLGILLGLFAGLIVARIGFRRLLIFALVLGALVSVIQSFLPALPIMLAIRVVEGMSHLIIVVAAPTLIVQVTAQRHRAMAMTLWSTFFGVSFALVAWFGIPLVDRHGAGSLFLVHAVALTVIAVALFILLPPQRKLSDRPKGIGLAEVVSLHKQIYRSPFKSAAAMGWLFYTMTFVSLLTVLPGFVAEESRKLVTSAMPLAGIASSMTVGLMLLRYFAAVRVVMLGFGLSAAVVLLLWMVPGDPVLSIALAAALGLIQGASFTAIPQLNSDPQALAHANGAVAQMGNFGNTIGTPLLLLMTMLMGYQGLIVFAVFCYTGGLLVHLLLARRRRMSPQVSPV